MDDKTSSSSGNCTEGEGALLMDSRAICLYEIVAEDAHGKSNLEGNWGANWTYSRMRLNEDGQFCL